MDRQSFIKSSITTTLGLSILPVFGAHVSQNEPSPLKTTMVKEFVVAGHKDLSKVQSMLADYPNLIYSRYDWGNGDFEEAIEGAGHLGNKEIANYLIDQGARVNMFVLTMLGKTELVKPTLEAYPNLVFAKGAHGFTLLHHANAGGDGNYAFIKYLNGKGLTEMNINIK